MNDTDNTSKLETGYDLPVYGIEDKTFYYIHVPAIVCIAFSFASVITVITLSFRRQSYKNFFTQWTKSERFIVYLALCDGGYNIFHSIDHLHIVIVRDHVRPKELCEFYGFTLAEFIMGQNLMVNIVAINAFMLIYFSKNLNFGKYDWRLLAWTFGLPFTGAAIAGIAGQLGPNGTFCYFDGVKGVTANICFTTVPLLIILAMNTVMYILTWKKIKEQTRNINALQSSNIRASHRAARTMSLFVAAFFIQWWSLALFGVWALVDDVPQTVFHFVTTFTNLGGCLNLGVYIIMRRRSQREPTDVKESREMSGPTELKSVSRLSDSGRGTITEPNDESTTAPDVENATKATEQNLSKM